MRQPHDIVDATEPGSGEMKDAVDDETSRGGQVTKASNPAKRLQTSHPLEDLYSDDSRTPPGWPAIIGGIGDRRHGP